MRYGRIPRSVHVIAAIVAGLTGLGAAGRPPSDQRPLPAAPPTTATAVAAWDVALVQRAAALVASPEHWNRTDDRRCQLEATALSIRCALQKAVEESAGIWRDPAGRRIPPPATRSDCRFDPAGASLEGSCGPLFDEVPVFAVAHASAVATGKWRADAQPTEIWAGTMSDAEYPMMAEADRTVALLTGKTLANPVTDFNNDGSTTFASVQAFFHMLEDQVAKRAAADFESNTDEVEIEAYADGSGVMRTYTGWFAVSGVLMANGSVKFQLDVSEEVAPNALDREILKRADAMLTSVAVWNRADNRQCPADAKTWSIYCAEERASIEATGGFDHRRPALEIVRQIVEERTTAKKYQHRLMGYNNDASTRLEDVHSLFAEAIARVK